MTLQRVIRTVLSTVHSLASVIRSAMQATSSCLFSEYAHVSTKSFGDSLIDVLFKVSSGAMFAHNQAEETLFHGLSLTNISASQYCVV